MVDQSRINPTSLLAVLGYRAEFHCNSNMPHLTEWNFNNGPLPSNAYTLYDLLSIQGLSKSNEGEYECNGVALKNPKIRFVAVGRLKVTG